MARPFLESYRGESIEQLIALKESHRIDSLVLAVEQALREKPAAELTEPARVVLVVEAMEREVNNGGFDQLLFNCSRESVRELVPALRLIGCPRAAAIAEEAIAASGVSQQSGAESACEPSDDCRAKLEECDARYYANDERVELRLFAFIEAHQHELRIP